MSPRTFPPAPGWSADGHRIKAPLEYSRGSDKAWVFGALRVRDGQVLTQTTASRNTAGYLELLQAIDHDTPTGEVYLIADNLSSHTSQPIRDWLAAHPRVHQTFIPVGRRGSISSKAGGACSVAPPSRGSVSPTGRRSP